MNSLENSKPLKRSQDRKLRRVRKLSPDSRSARAAQFVAAGATLAEAAKRFGISPQSVHIAWQRRFPDIPSPQRQYSFERKQAIMQYVTGEQEIKGKKKLICSLSAKEIAKLANPSLGLTEAQVRSIASTNGVKLARNKAAGPDCETAFAALRGGASLTEAAALVRIAPGTLTRLAAKAGIRIKRRHTGIRDGRTLRAIIRVLLRGQSITEACLEELCAQPGVRNGLNHGTTGLKICDFLYKSSEFSASLEAIMTCSVLDAARMQKIIETLVQSGLLFIRSADPIEWALTDSGKELCVAWEKHQKSKSS